MERVPLQDHAQGIQHLLSARDTIKENLIPQQMLKVRNRKTDSQTLLVGLQTDTTLLEKGNKLRQTGHREKKTYRPTPVATKHSTGKHSRLNQRQPKDGRMDTNMSLSSQTKYHTQLDLKKPSNANPNEGRPIQTV